MAARGRFLLTLGVMSGVLASFVPGVFEPAASTPPIQLEAATRLVVTVAAGPVAPSSATQPRPAELEANRRPTDVPPGCERLVSPLARSTATASIGRCIT